MTNKISSEICQKCGKCCQARPFVELSPNEIAAIEKLTNLPRESFTYPKDKAGTLFFLQFKENGHCIFLNENNGVYSCGIYEVRSKLCRDYPSNAKQEAACAAKRGIASA